MFRWFIMLSFLGVFLYAPQSEAARGYFGMFGGYVFGLKSGNGQGPAAGANIGFLTGKNKKKAWGLGFHGAYAKRSKSETLGQNFARYAVEVIYTRWGFVWGIRIGFLQNQIKLIHFTGATMAYNLFLSKNVSLGPELAFNDAGFTSRSHPELKNYSVFDTFLVLKFWF